MVVSANLSFNRYKFWIILIILTVIYAVLVYLFLPEVSSSQPTPGTQYLTNPQTKGMTLEDISLVFGDPVELSFEQALSKEGAVAEGVIAHQGPGNEKDVAAGDSVGVERL